MLDMSKLARFAQKQRENDKAASDNSDARSSVLTEQQEEILDVEAYEKAEIYIPPEIIYGEGTDDDVSAAASDENLSESNDERYPDISKENNAVMLAAPDTDTSDAEEMDAMSEEEIKKEIDDIVMQYFSDNIQLIETERLLAYHNHTFAPMEGAKLESFAKSIERLGMQDAILVRSVGSGEYEIISGHNRKLAAELLGWKKVPCRVGDNAMLTSDIADEIMVSCNLDRRTELKHSELAKSLALLMEARRKQQPDFDDKGRTRDKVAAEFGMSKSQVQRYVALSKLNNALLDMLDNGELPFVAATNLTELSDIQQDILLEVLQATNKKINTRISEQLRKAAAEADKFTADNIKEMLTAKPKPVPKITAAAIERVASKYFVGKTAKEAEEIIENALAMYFGKIGADT